MTSNDKQWAREALARNLIYTAYHNRDGSFLVRYSTLINVLLITAEEIVNSSIDLNMNEVTAYLVSYVLRSHKRAIERGILA